MRMLCSGLIGASLPDHDSSLPFCLSRESLLSSLLVFNYDLPWLTTISILITSRLSNSQKYLLIACLVLYVDEL